MSKSTSARTDLLLTTIVSGIEEVKGHDIISLDMGPVNSAICDHFVICHGSSTTQVEAIADKVKKFTDEALSERPWRSEGYGNAQWILLDYVDIVVHIFYKEARTFYNLEDLWGDAEVTRYDSDDYSTDRIVSN